MRFPSIAPPTPRVGLAWVYILQTEDGSLYVGQTHDVVERLRKHRLGLGSKHTADHKRPILVYCEGPLGLVDAVARESQLKGWSRLKKEALIRDDLESLHILSRSRDQSGVVHVNLVHPARNDLRGIRRTPPFG